MAECMGGMKMKKYGEGCQGCKYWKCLDTTSKSLLACHYMIETGEQRGCDAGAGCVHYVRKKGREKNVVH